LKGISFPSTSTTEISAAFSIISFEGSSSETPTSPRKSAVAGSDWDPGAGSFPGAEDVSGDGIGSSGFSSLRCSLTGLPGETLFTFSTVGFILPRFLGLEKTVVGHGGEIQPLPVGKQGAYLDIGSALCRNCPRVRPSS
jgi:hypothetical protein